jgi:hypothetical protein
MLTKIAAKTIARRGYVNRGVAGRLDAIGVRRPSESQGNQARKQKARAIEVPLNGSLPAHLLSRLFWATEGAKAFEDSAKVGVRWRPRGRRSDNGADLPGCRLARVPIATTARNSPCAKLMPGRYRAPGAAEGSHSSLPMGAWLARNFPASGCIWRRGR